MHETVTLGVENYDGVAYSQFISIYLAALLICVEIKLQFLIFKINKF